MVRRIVVLMGTALLSMLVAMPAGAAGPVVGRNDLEFSLNGADCGDGLTYDIVLEGMETIQDLGDRVISHTVWDGDAVGSDGTTLRVHHVYTVELDFVAGTGTITGIGFGTSVEGSSIKRLDRGRLVFDLATDEDLFVAGSWPPFDPHEATCDLIMAANA